MHGLFLYFWGIPIRRKVYTRPPFVVIILTSWQVNTPKSKTDHVSKASAHLSGWTETTSHDLLACDGHDVYRSCLILQ